MLIYAASNASSGWLTTLLEETRLARPESGWLGYIATHQWLNVIAFGLAALLLIVATRGRLGYREGAWRHKMASSEGAPMMRSMIVPRGILQ